MNTSTIGFTSVRSILAFLALFLVGAHSVFAAPPTTQEECQTLADQMNSDRPTVFASSFSMQAIWQMGSCGVPVSNSSASNLESICASYESGVIQSQQMGSACVIGGGQGDQGFMGQHQGMLDDFRNGDGFATMGFGLDTADMANDSFGQAMMQFGGDFDVDPRAMSEQAMGAMRGMMEGVVGSLMGPNQRDVNGSLSLTQQDIETEMSSFMGQIGATMMKSFPKSGPMAMDSSDNFVLGQFEPMISAMFDASGTMLSAPFTYQDLDSGGTRSWMADPISQPIAWDASDNAGIAFDFSDASDAMNSFFGSNAIKMMIDASDSFKSGVDVHNIFMSARAAALDASSTYRGKSLSGGEAIEIDLAVFDASDNLLDMGEGSGNDLNGVQISIPVDETTLQTALNMSGNVDDAAVQAAIDNGTLVVYTAPTFQDLELDQSVMALDASDVTFMRDSSDNLFFETLVSHFSVFVPAIAGDATDSTGFVIDATDDLIGGWQLTTDASTTVAFGPFNGLSTTQFQWVEGTDTLLGNFELLLAGSIGDGSRGDDSIKRIELSYTENGRQEKEHLYLQDPSDTLYLAESYTDGTDTFTVWVMDDVSGSQSDFSDTATVPEITSVSLGNSVTVTTDEVSSNNPTFLTVASSDFDFSNGSSNIFIMPGQSAGDATNTSNSAPDLSGGTTASDSNPIYNSGPIKMTGLDGFGYGAFLIDFTPTELAATQSSSTGLFADPVKNHNSKIFGMSAGPLGLGATSLSSAGIPVDTPVTFTVDLNGQTPQAVMIMGMGTPQVTYEPNCTGTDCMLTVTANTFSNRNYGDTDDASDSQLLDSTIGFSIITDSSLSTINDGAPLGLVAQVDHWVGDIYPLIPGVGSLYPNNASGAVAGDKGMATARCGTTIFGPTAESRDITLFMPAGSVASMLGLDTAVTDAISLGTVGDVIDDISTYVDNVKDETVQVKIAQNFGRKGVQLNLLDFQFASPKDIAFGKRSTSSPSGSYTTVTFDSSDAVNQMDGAWIEDDSDQERLVFNSSAQTLTVYDATGTLLESGTYRFVSAGDSIAGGVVSEDRIVVTKTDATGTVDFYLYDSTDSLDLVDYEMVSFTDASDSSKKLIWWELLEEDSSDTGGTMPSSSPTITITTPSVGNLTDLSPNSVVLSVAVTNFQVGSLSDTTADGHWHYTLDGGSEVMVFDISPVTLSESTLTAGSHTLHVFLVDPSHNAHSSNASDTVTFTIVDNTPTGGNGNSGTAGVTWNLDSGWNLVGLSADATDGFTTLMDAQEADGDVVSVWHYNNASDSWLFYLNGDASGTSTLTTMEAGNAYWIHVAENETMTVNFTEAAPGQIPAISAGWNMRAAINYTSDLSTYVSSEGVDAVWGWQDDFWQSYIAGTPQFLNFLQQMEMGKGYYLYKQ